MRGIDDACLHALRSATAPAPNPAEPKGQRASEPIARFGWQAVPSRHGEAAELTAGQRLRSVG